MIRKMTFVLFASAALFCSGYSITIDGTAPQVTITNPAVTGPIRTAIEGEMNTMLTTTFNQTLDEARTNLATFNDQKNMAKAFANANAFSTHSATLAGFQNYKHVAIGSGMMVGVQAPSTDLGYYGKIADEINENGDLYAGIGVGFTYVNLGLNASFLMPGLYLNAKYGGMGFELGGFKYDFSVYGLGANYRLLEAKSLVGLVKWRGISLGTGFYHQSNTVEMTISGIEIANDIPFRDNIVGLAGSSAEVPAYEAGADALGFTAAQPNAVMTLVPEFTMGLDVSTSTIPLEASTAVAVLFGLFNVSAGAGIDINFGSTDIGLKGTSTVTTEAENPAASVTFDPASVDFDGTSDAGPSFARPRIMLGLGLGLGPLKLDIPVNYYPAAGMSFGVSGLFVW